MRHIKQDAARIISSWQNVERVLRLHVVPRLGDTPIADIRRADVHEIRDCILSPAVVKISAHLLDPKKHPPSLRVRAATRQVHQAYARALELGW
jgi:hypothetical protein